jgi:hypothetical protein
MLCLFSIPKAKAAPDPVHPDPMTPTRYDAFRQTRQDFDAYLERRYADSHAPSADPASGAGNDSAPIDGGLSLLLAAGLGLGIKKAASKKGLPAQANEIVE